jgi:hypothetical protein
MQENETNNLFVTLMKKLSEYFSKKNIPNDILENEIQERVMKTLKTQHKKIKSVAIEVLRDQYNGGELKGYRPVYRCTCQLQTGESKVYYVKLSFNDMNIFTQKALMYMASFGYHIPNSVTLLTNQEIKLNPNQQQKCDIVKKAIKNPQKKFDILITEDAKSFMPKKYLKDDADNNELNVVMTKDEAIDLLLLQLTYGVDDNKSINTTQLKKLNDKSTNVFFDPLLSHTNFILNIFFTSIGVYIITENKIITEEEMLKKNLHNTFVNKHCFEAHVFRLIQTFFIRQNYIKEGEQNNLTIGQMKEIFKKLSEMQTLMKKKKEVLIEKNKELLIDFLQTELQNVSSKPIQKKRYFWNKNNSLQMEFSKEYKESAKDQANPFLIRYGKVNTLLTNPVTDTQETYEPKLLSSLDTQSFATDATEYQSRYLFNLKNLDQIKYYKTIKAGEEEIGCNITPLYKEKRLHLDDSWISSDIGDKKAVQQQIVNTLVELTNKHNVSLQHLSYIIVESIKQDGYSSINGNKEDSVGKKLSAEFQKNMQAKKIYTGRVTNLGDATVGLRLKRLPKAIIELLNDNKDKFTTKESDDTFKIPAGLKKRDEFIIQRTI